MLRRKEITMHGSRIVEGEEAISVRLEASRSIVARHNSRMDYRYDRVETLPLHRRSVERAMLGIEEKLVKALWVIERSTSSDKPRGYDGRNGFDYMPEAIDLYGEAVAKGGYETPPARPALPESKEITEARQTQRLLELLDDPREARVLTVGAMSKRGDPGRRVNWSRVKERLPELKGFTDRHLRGIYSAALRSMVAELAFPNKR